MTFFQPSGPRNASGALTFDLLVRGGTLVSASGRERADLGIRAGKVVAIGAFGDHEGGEILDARGLHVLPGVIDPQVHFREPGLTHKEDLESGTRSAILGGVTSVLEMPNTLPPTTSLAALADKRARAAGRVHCDIGFFGGATTENADDLPELEAAPGCAGIKIFMGSSTGSLLVPDDASLLRVLRAGRRRVAVHAEDEDRLRERRPLALAGRPETHPVWRDEETAVRATRRLLSAAREAGRLVHVLHVTSAGELPLLAAARDLATFETLPQHLTFASPEIYERLGTLAQMNPPIREARHRDALWEAVTSGLVDCLATDHAPHTLEEKARPYPESPSGMPGVQTLLPVLLDHVARGRLALERLVALTSAGPARVWGIPGKGRLEPGFDADLVLVDLERRHTLGAGEMASRCGWTPFEGLDVTGWPVATVLRGRVAMRDGDVLGPPSGRVLYSSPTSS